MTLSTSSGRLSISALTASATSPTVDAARARDERQVRGGGADHRDLLAGPLEHDAAGDPAGVGQRLQARLAGEVEVGGKERDVGIDARDEVGEHLGAEVELVVADRERVIVDRVDHHAVVERRALLERGVELGPGEEVVARAQRHHRARHLARVQSGAALGGGGLALQLDQAHEGRSPAIALELGAGVQQLQFGIVVVQDREAERRRVLGRGAAARGEQRAEREAANCGSGDASRYRSLLLCSGKRIASGAAGG